MKTPARFHTNLFRSLFRGLRAFRIGKIAKKLALLDRLEIFAEFPHSLGRQQPIAIKTANASEGRIPVLPKATAIDPLSAAKRAFVATSWSRPYVVAD